MSEAKPLGKRINEAMVEIDDSITWLVDMVLHCPLCDDELPPDSGLSESYLCDLHKANELIKQATKLIEGLTPEALENE